MAANPPASAVWSVDIHTPLHGHSSRFCTDGIKDASLKPLFGLDQAFLHQAAVELLDVRVDALPVGLAHPHQVVGVQQRGAACQPPADREPWSCCALILHTKNKSSLCGAEGQLEVVLGLVGVEGRVLEGVGEEAVHQGAEGDAVLPTGGKVLDVDPLFQSRFW